MEDHGLPYPTLIDNDFGYWKALGNQYWPTFYLADRKGCLRLRRVGETHADTERARSMEKAIEMLLSEE